MTFLKILAAFSLLVSIIFAGGGLVGAIWGQSPSLAYVTAAAMWAAFCICWTGVEILAHKIDHHL